MLLGVGDGLETQFQLTRPYTSGGETYLRPITKPVAGTVLIGLDGTVQQESVHFTTDIATGIVTFTAPPPAGLAITAGFEFDVPVRFDTDRINISMANFQAGEAPDVPVIEVWV